MMRHPRNTSKNSTLRAQAKGNQISRAREYPTQALSPCAPTINTNCVVCDGNEGQLRHQHYQRHESREKQERKHSMRLQPFELCNGCQLAPLSARNATLDHHIAVVLYGHWAHECRHAQAGHGSHAAVHNTACWCGKLILYWYQYDRPACLPPGHPARAAQSSHISAGLCRTLYSVCHSSRVTT
eukprot:scaffold34271_cov40-Prasinocladus_malaysianus.AAC.1